MLIMLNPKLDENSYNWINDNENTNHCKYLSVENWSENCLKNGQHHGFRIVVLFSEFIV